MNKESTLELIDDLFEIFKRHLKQKIDKEIEDFHFNLRRSIRLEFENQ